MAKFPAILLWSLLLLAVAAILLPSCNVSSRSGSQRSGTEEDSISSAADSARLALLEEFGQEDFQPLPSGWENAYQRRYKRERKKPLEQPDTTLTFTTPLEIIPTDSTTSDTDSGETLSPESGKATVPIAEDSSEISEDEEDIEGGTETEAAGDSGDMRTIDYYGDIARPVHITEDSSAVYLLGNVIVYHNGAVITADSAVRFSENHFEFYKRVVINNGTTYVYGDRAEYRGELNLARVYSPIVKVVDQDAVLYTYNFSYNTLTEAGRYWGGGTLTHNDSQMESLRGYYDTQTREFTEAGEVELTNPDYKLVSDSVLYNLDTEEAQFFVPSVIWNSKGDILLADRGKYRNATEDYQFTSNSYILTENQEIWADSIEHYAADDYTVMRRDIQIIDEENSTMAFGDYGEYYGETEQAMLTMNPSLLSFDSEAQEPDTIYMRSDSMFVYTFPHDHVFEGLQNAEPEDLTSEFEERMERPIRPLADSTAIDSLGSLEVLEIDETDPDNEEAQTESQVHKVAEEGPPDEDSEAEPTPAVQHAVLTKRQQRRADRKAGRQDIALETSPTPEEKENTELAEEEITQDEHVTVDPGLEEETVPGDEDSETEPVSQPEPEIYNSPYAELIERLHRQIAADSTEKSMTAERFWLRVSDQINADSVVMDRYLEAMEEAMASGEIDARMMEVPAGNPETIIEIVITESRKVIESLPEARPEEETIESDSVQRVFFGYRNVKIYRDDFQAVCDSLVGFSKDSTMHMHIDPVMWNDQNQIFSDVMIIYSRDEQLYKVEYYGSPFMSQEVDSLANQYNQIKGKFMVAWFRDNDIYRHDVQGNVQTYFYNEDDYTGEVTELFAVESADATFFFVDNQIDDLIYRGNPDFQIYPVSMIPPDVEQLLPGFKWEAYRRPMRKEDVHNRFIRPRQRAEVEALSQPTFPLTERMDKRKEELTRTDVWRDRNDVLSPFAIEMVQQFELQHAE